MPVRSSEPDAEMHLVPGSQENLKEAARSPWCWRAEAHVDQPPSSNLHVTQGHHPATSAHTCS